MTDSPRAVLLLLILLLALPATALAQAPPPDLARTTNLPKISALFKEQRDHVVSVQTEMAAPMFSANPFSGPRDGNPLRGQGSGFIIDSDGFAVTNWHVVSGAQSIQVTLADGPSYPARLIGADPSTDIALIKIDSPRPLATAEMGTIQNMTPGQWVMAVGSPFGLEHSVTVGVLSATGRQIGMGPYDNFLQTDASINPGNSGGPLFNLDGEVIGVNTAIIRNGSGIGFAVPIDTVKEILPQLRQRCYVVRGFIGAGVQEMSPDLAATFGLDPRAGVLLRSVEPNGPAHRAGLRAGDIITRLNGTPTSEPSDLLALVAGLAPGIAVGVDFYRDDTENHGEITVAERPDPSRQEIERTRQAAADFAPGRLGVILRSLTSILAARVGTPPGIGVYVDRVEAGSPASGVLQQGDVILQINGTDVNDPADVPRLLNNAPDQRPIRMLIRRHSEPHFVAVRLWGA